MSMFLERILHFCSNIFKQKQQISNTPNVERSIILGSIQDAELRKHLLRSDGQEDLCFALYKESVGIRRKNFIIYKVILQAETKKERCMEMYPYTKDL